MTPVPASQGIRCLRSERPAGVAGVHPDQLRHHGVYWSCYDRNQTFLGSIWMSLDPFYSALPAKLSRTAPDMTGDRPTEAEVSRFMYVYGFNKNADFVPDTEPKSSSLTCWQSGEATIIFKLPQSLYREMQALFFGGALTSE